MVLEEWGEHFDVLIGRVTYDQWSSFWPQAPKGFLMADRLNAATKHVVTHRPESLKWGPVEWVGPDLVEGVRRNLCLYSWCPRQDHLGKKVWEENRQGERDRLLHQV